MEQIKILGKQIYKDNPDMMRITMDIPRIAWLVLQQEIKSKSFGNIVDVPDQEIKVLDTTSTIDTYA
jgi:hypothetical protein